MGLGTGFIFLLAVAGQAMPPYANLFRTKYKYRPNCTLCHDADSWEPNGYGKLFLKGGRSLEALSRIEPEDPDGDGHPSLKEIEARSNPGDPRSTPDRLGEWLARLPVVQPPLRHLEALFADAPGQPVYSLEEPELRAITVRKLEHVEGRALRPEERYPSYFRARFTGVPGKQEGFALYASTEGDEPCFFLAGYLPSPDGKVWVSGVRMLKCGSRRLRSPRYLDQFKNKLPAELQRVRPAKPEDAAQSDQVVQAVRRGAVLVGELVK